MDRKREQLLQNWARSQLNDAKVKITPLAGDASFRSYLRAVSQNQSFIIMNAPPEREDVLPWINIAKRLRNASLNAPEIFYQDLANGFILMSDLGDITYLDVLNAETVDELYRDAISALFGMQQRVKADDLPVYDEARLRAEMNLFPEWFLERHLGLTIKASERMIIERMFEKLVASALEQPQAFVHRDYHSRNLMKRGWDNPGILDFQDAVKGPITYDLVSLVRDCYIEWPQEKVLVWINQYRDRLSKAGVIADKELRFKRWFDWMGLQRHIKVLGIFARLNYRDGKSGYLKDLPRVLQYVLDVAGKNKELGPFSEWLADKTAGIDLTQPRQLEEA
ncbi:aminoglycoside phosphotransferase [Ahniella affigens]|uniref:Aminoglycoside phosphotransferase n=1 Tax=Ahniella affigens TaxID=2021234 RepID=A0A2P1PY99_9GAMM|nr:phosphotransferase [Ahniella affigens]AVP99800.1 aminoglycoside phosphotransferase [Ahniella affigens]